MAEILSTIERRVLAHLPDWAADEAWHVENEGGPGVSIRSYTLQEIAQRMAADPGTRVEGRALTEPETLQTLQVLEHRGFAEIVEDTHWKMTELGFETLTGAAHVEDSVPGPVDVELHPARMDSAGTTGGQA